MIDEGSPVDIRYLDFQKAIDKLPHHRLLLKLKAHVIGDGIIDWTEQWLTDRRQRVLVDGEVSNWKQNDLDKLVKWSEKWQVLFNFWKCKYLHTGYRNLDVNYKMGDTVLGTTVKQKDLGVTINADMKVSEQCGIAASKGNTIFGLIRRNITWKEANYTPVYSNN